MSIVTPTKKRNFGLDAIRTFSIWLVLLQHSGYPIIPELKSLKIGGIGVEIFFVLSGFLIGGILFKALEKENSLQSVKKFWIRRWFRILPVYYLVIIFKFFVLDNSIGGNLIYYLLFLQNNFYGIGFYSVTWSLVIEEWFYLFAPIFIFILIKIFKAPKKIWVPLLLFLLAENIARYIYVKAGDVPFSGVHANFPFRFDSLFIGVLVAYLKLYYQSLYRKLQNLPVFLIGLGAFTGYAYLLYRFSHPTNQMNVLLFPRTVGMFIHSLSIATMIPYIESFKQMPQQKIWHKTIFHFITQTSLLTYSIYLLHPLLFEFVDTVFSIKQHYLQTIIGVGLTYVCAQMVYSFFEKPVLNLRERFS